MKEKAKDKMLESFFYSAYLCVWGGLIAIMMYSFYLLYAIMGIIVLPFVILTTGIMIWSYVLIQAEDKKYWKKIDAIIAKYPTNDSFWRRQKIRQCFLSSQRK
jgi:hypothetical protein